jgi:hypothetical protein
MDLRERRTALTEEVLTLGAAPEAVAVARFQRELAGEIIEAESAHRSAKSEERLEWKHHIRRLRAHADALAWWAFHPHAIRQLAKGGHRAQTLSSQGAALEHALAVVEELASEGIVSIASDLTSDLRLGDVVIVDSRDAPTIVECKRTLPPNDAPLRGRVGRQSARLHGTADYMRHGIAQFPGEPMARICVEGRPSEPRWDRVEEAVEAALLTGRAVTRVLGPRHVVVVLPRDVPMPGDLQELVGDFESIAIGAHVRFLDDERPLVPPPLSWPLSRRARTALMEGELTVAVLLDPSEFTRLAAERGRVVTVCDGGLLLVEDEGRPYVVNSRFFGECLYGFARIEAQVEDVLDLVAFARAAEIEPLSPELSAPEAPRGPPARVRRVETTWEVLALENRPRRRDEVLMMSRSAADQLPPEKRPGVIYDTPRGIPDGEGVRASTPTVDGYGDGDAAGVGSSEPQLAGPCSHCGGRESACGSETPGADG